MKQFNGYSKQNIGDTSVLLAGGGHALISTVRTGNILTNTLSNTEYPLVFGSSWIDSSTTTSDQVLRTAGVSTSAVYCPLRVYPGANNAAGTEGNAYIVLGNAYAKSSANNRTGSLYMYGDGTYWGNIKPISGLTANRSYSLPDANGTIALTSNLSSYVLKAGDTMSGALIFSGVTGGNFNEGIRIQDAASKWAGITFGATGTSGISPQSGEVAWFAAKQPGGVFAITANTSSASYGLSLTKNGDIKWYGNILLHAGNYTDYVYSKSTSDGRYLRKDTNDSTPYQYTFSKTDDHAIQIGTIRGYGVGSCTGNYLHIYERVHIGSPSGWGSRNAPSYGLSTYGGAWLATDTGNVGIGTTTPAEKLDVDGGQILRGTLEIYPGNISNWREGIRIHSANNGWTTLMLCGTDNTGTSGKSANSWSFHSYTGDFYLTKNGSNTGTTMLSCVSNLWAFSTGLTAPSFTKSGSSDYYLLTGGGGHVHRNNSGISGTASAITALDVTYSFLYASIKTGQTLGLSAAMSVGQVLTVLVYNNSASSIAITVPSGWRSLDGSSLTCSSYKFLEISILCYSSGAYLVSCKGE